MNFWRRKKREEFTANNINAGNGKTGIVAVMENAQWASVSDFGGVAVAMGNNGRATARGYLGVALATRTQGEAKKEAAPKPMTNGDRIRDLQDGELAERERLERLYEETRQIADRRAWDETSRTMAYNCGQEANDGQ